MSDIKWNYQGNNDPSQEWKDKYIVNIKGKEAVTVAGLTILAHAKGIKSLKTKIIQYPSKENDMTAICETTLVGYDWSPMEKKMVEVEFTAIGDANVGNCTPMVAKSYIRMAETRSVGRCLGKYVDLPMVTSEEIYNAIDVPGISNAQIKMISNIMKTNSLDVATSKKICLSVSGKDSVKSLNANEAAEYINRLSAYAKQSKNKAHQATQQSNSQDTSSQIDIDDDLNDLDGLDEAL